MEAPFDINCEESQPFEIQDPFNDNIIKGYILKVRSGRKYGMLWITHVNGLLCEQPVYCTPKLSYPYKGDGNIIYEDMKKVDWEEIPSDKMIAFEKIDGSAITAFIYKDASGKRFVSYKTRLTPSLKENKFANFKMLWDDILKKYPNIPSVVLKNGRNIVFEMYGMRNLILVEYPGVALDIKTIFGVNGESGDLSLPTNLFMENIPVADIIKELNPGNFRDDYFELKKYLDTKIQVTRVQTPSELRQGEMITKIQNIVGMEGCVIYSIKDGVVSQWKCKPKEIEDLHRTGDGIPYHSIYTTIINSFEISEEPTWELVMNLLKEEFQEAEIYKKEMSIKKLIAEITFEKKIKSEIFQIYRENKLDIVGNKRDCMRFFAGKYPKTMATKIYNYLNQEFGVV